MTIQTSQSTQRLGSPGQRIAIIGGLRTPFAKQGTAFGNLSALDLGRIVVSELLQRYPGIDKEVELLTYGQVIPAVTAPNVAREIVLAAGLRNDIDAYSISRACTTGYQTVVSAAEAIAAGSVSVAIAGGTDSASDIPMVLTRKLAGAFLKLSKAKTLMDRVNIITSTSLADWRPVPPALKERSTGLTMGEATEKMAKENGILRDAQDAFANRSHQNAARAWADGTFKDQVMTVFVPPDFKNELAEDNLVRKDSKLESYSNLKPVFDRAHGTITAGNSSPLTDGASAVLLMREDKAKSLGLEPLGYLRSYSFYAVDPADQLLIGPAYTTPIALDRAGLTLKDINILDVHEAFAAQVLSVTQALESKAFAEKKLNRSEAVGKIDWDHFNVDGGSIALGHPFGATGGRQVIQALHALKRHKGQFALATACAAGGLASTLILEAA